MPSQIIVITNEAQAWEVLERAVTEGMPEEIELRFEGWPTFEMNIQGRDWHSTVPTRIMTPLLDVQKDINRAYASVKYGNHNLRRLKDEERDELEMVVKVREGSSNFGSELWEQFSIIGKAAVERMNGTEAVVTVLGLALTFAAHATYKAWLSQRQKEKELEHQVQMSQEETRKLEVFASAQQRQPILVVAQEEIQATQNRFLKVVKPGDVLNVKGEAIRAEDASALAQPERERAVDLVIEGMFSILGNRTDRSEGFRITVKRISDQLTLNADVPIELPYVQQQIIQEAEWRKTQVYLSINASMLRDSISQASVITASAALPGQQPNHENGA